MVNDETELHRTSSAKRGSILARLWHYHRVMAPALARYALLGAGIATLVACFVEGAVATFLGALAAALFPPALMLLPCGDSGPPPWIVALAASLAGGMSVVVFWSGSVSVAGLPAATWASWLLLGVVPLLLVLYGVVLRGGET
jgi:hypothetical protein